VADEADTSRAKQSEAPRVLKVRRQFFNVLLELLLGVPPDHIWDADINDRRNISHDIHDEAMPAADRFVILKERSQPLFAVCVGHALNYPFRSVQLLLTQRE
jgi:hypothetical protein